ncbi:hypothetical protein [Sporolactobacillus putidus]|uniref:Uncharacterized protein n=1 Tax=Sporolactobacillus putidus TaxID=492735 RepID=A0A917W1P6_9BACL|nr:hypothetical protein [Sporolactobacillus putidus]GGL51730.1 hypothetical protein GCM10007968_14840 [Sporolactobacillus putidus]
MNDCYYHFAQNDDTCRKQEADLPVSIQKEINLGRTGHYYRIRLASFAETMTIRLLSFNPSTGMVGMNIYNPWQRLWVYRRARNKDIHELAYLGPAEPQTGTMEGSARDDVPGVSAAGISQKLWWGERFLWYPWCR